MADVRQQQRPYLIGNRPETLVIPIPAVRRRTANEQLRLHFAGGGLHFVHVNQARFLLHPIKMGRIQLSRIVHRRTVRQVATVAQIKSQDGIARVQHGQHHRGIR